MSKKKQMEQLEIEHYQLWYIKKYYFVIFW